MANPRIDELRARLQREPGSRLFAQLAEELRKDGELNEAIRVARSGLAVHPNYPSARLTLGRALIESGNLTGARTELESVLRGAPDNILASRMLAECLEGLGDFGAALLQFRAALRLSPGDRQIEGQVRALEQRLAGGHPATARPAAEAPTPAPGSPVSMADSGTTLPPYRTEPGAPTPGPAAARAPSLPGAAAGPTAPPRGGGPQAPSPVPAPAPPAPMAAPGSAGGDFDDVFEAPPSWTAGGEAQVAPDNAPILLLEDEAPTMPGGPAFVDTGSTGPERAEGRPDTAAFPAVALPEAPVTLTFEREPPAREPSPASPRSTDTLAGAPAFPIVEEAPPTYEPFGSHGNQPAWPGLGGAPPPEPPPAAAPFVASAPLSEPAASDTSTTLAKGSAAALGGEATAAAPVAESSGVLAPPSPAPPLRSATLAELYLEQGFPDKAASVYEEMLESDPYDHRSRARLIEIKRMAATTPAFAGLASAPLAGREEAAAAPAPAVPEAPEPAPAFPAAAVAAVAPPVPPVDDPNAPRRRALERTIRRLEQMLVAVRRD